MKNSPWRVISSVTMLACVMSLVEHGEAYARATPVEVENWPDTQVVRDADSPANQPFQFDDSNFSEIDGRTSLSLGVSSPLVPEGKRLIVQHISFDFNSTGFEAEPVCDVDVIAVDAGGHLSWVVTHPLAPTRYERAYDRVSYISSSPITLYADPSSKVQVGCSAVVSQNTGIKAAITGYYVDL